MPIERSQLGDAPRRWLQKILPRVNMLVGSCGQLCCCALKSCSSPDPQPPPSQVTPLSQCLPHPFHAVPLTDYDGIIRPVVSFSTPSKELDAL